MPLLNDIHLIEFKVKENALGTLTVWRKWLKYENPSTRSLYRTEKSKHLQSIFIRIMHTFHMISKLLIMTEKVSLSWSDVKKDDDNLINLPFDSYYYPWNAIWYHSQVCACFIFRTVCEGGCLHSVIIYIPSASLQLLTMYPDAWLDFSQPFLELHSAIPWCTSFKETIK